jgi:hypothetical protein
VAVHRGHVPDTRRTRDFYFPGRPVATFSNRSCSAAGSALKKAGGAARGRRGAPCRMVLRWQSGPDQVDCGTSRCGRHLYIYRDIVRIREEFRIDAKGRAISEGKVCKLTVESTGRSTLVILRGRHGQQEARVWMDERTRDTLGVAVGDKVVIRLAPQRIFGAWRWAMRSSDITYRIAAQLALLSVGLGVLGLALGVLSILK